MPPGLENPFHPPHEPTLTDAQAVGKVLGAADQAAMEAVLGEETLGAESTVDSLPSGGIELTPAEREKLEGPDLREAIEVMGRENVHGPDDVEKMLGFRPREIPPFRFERKDFEKAKELGEMLVLRLDKDRTGKPLSGARLNETLTQKYEELDLGKPLHESDNLDRAWYKDEPFFTTDTPKLEWAFVTKEYIPNSKIKPHHFEQGDYYTHEDTQQYVIEQYIKKHKLDPSKVRRRIFPEQLYDTALHLIATQGNERLLASEYDWGDSQTSGRSFVNFGSADAHGAGVRDVSRDDWDVWHGVCLSR